jgi:hypothetical protein
MIEVAQKGLDRAQTGAQSTRNAAAAIGVLYSAVLGVTFSVDKPLPARGAIPAFFLGLAIVMATVYEAFPWRPKKQPNFPEETGKPLYDQQTYSEAFVLWMTARVNLKAYALRVAILSLALGVAFLPVGFLSLGRGPLSATDLPAWPIPPSTSANLELAKLLYQKQVDEVALRRSGVVQGIREETLRDPGVLAVYAAFVSSLAAILLHPVPAWIRRRLARRRRGKSGRDSENPTSKAT